ncbi:MAG: peptide deformylase [Pseudanabaenaceae cyanobacterium bins.68]|nr:peptide deformylase [Pseudanabaenaceae cyanobacterium bins.68]
MLSTLVPKQKLKHPPLQVHKLGDRVLRQPAKRINKITDETRHLAIQMLQTMYSEDGIGLAAPQVGVNKQLIVIDIELKDQTKPALVMINPELKSSGGDLVVGEEGCLSVPEVFFDVQRPDQVQVAYRDLDGKPQILKADGLLARVIQHEMDHLQGVLFVDRVQNSPELAKSLTKHGFAIKDVEPLKN